MDKGPIQSDILENHEMASISGQMSRYLSHRAAQKGSNSPQGLKVVFFRLKHANLGDRMSTTWIKMIDVSRV